MLTTPFFIVEVTQPNNGFSLDLPCVATGLGDDPDTFHFVCDSPPPDGSDLHYVVGNLPEHTVGG
jgi:hypothetical protein